MNEPLLSENSNVYTSEQQLGFVASGISVDCIHAPCQSHRYTAGAANASHRGRKSPTYASVKHSLCVRSQLQALHCSVPRNLLLLPSSHSPCVPVRVYLCAVLQAAQSPLPAAEPAAEQHKTRTFPLLLQRAACTTVVLCRQAEAVPAVLPACDNPPAAPSLPQ